MSVGCLALFRFRWFSFVGLFYFFSPDESSSQVQFTSLHPRGGDSSSKIYKNTFEGLFFFCVLVLYVIPSLLSGWVYFSTGSSIAKMCYGTREVAFFQMCGLEGYVYVFVVSKKSFSHPSSGVCERIGAVRDFILI